MRIPGVIRTVLLVGGIGFGLSGCVAYDPYAGAPYGYSSYGGSPYYGSPYYGGYAPAPSVGLGLSFTDYGGGWRHRRWR